MGQPPPATIGMPRNEIDTPCLVVELDALERNLDRMAAFLDGTGVRLRPHAKTHKSADIGRLQIERGAVGLCCQKTAEAEALFEAGIEDILISNQVVGKRKVERLADLASRTGLAVCVDDLSNVRSLHEACDERGSTLGVLVEIDVGGHRCGVRDAGSTVRLVREIAASPALHYQGLQAYHGSAQHIRDGNERRRAVDDAKSIVAKHVEALHAAGFNAPAICGGGTGTLAADMEARTWTELQAGSYVFLDTDYAANHAFDDDAPAFEHALFVDATVMSAPEPGLAVGDAGHKAVPIDSGPPAVAGAEVLGLSDEHVAVRFADGRAITPGDRLTLIPSHCDPTVNLHEWYVGVRNGRVEAVWPVTARGAHF